MFFYFIRTQFCRSSNQNQKSMYLMNVKQYKNRSPLKTMNCQKEM